MGRGNSQKDPKVGRHGLFQEWTDRQTPVWLELCKLASRWCVMRLDTGQGLWRGA